MGALLGPFWLNKPLAAGGMGEVWSGVHRDQGVQVAIKFLTRDASDPDFRDAFDAEVAAMSAMDHPNVVRIYDYGEVGANATENLRKRVGVGTPYIVMEQARGTLADRAEPLPWPTVHTALQHLLAALAHAHARDMLHRDLKPGNVLLCPGEREGDADRIVLTDFGFAGQMGERESKIVGLTPSYAAPEQLRWESREEGPWTDLFALGCLAWRLLTGVPPYHATSVDDALAKQARGIPRLDVPVPPGVHDWLRRALSPFPEGRFPSAADAASALADAVEGQSMTLAALPKRPTRPPKRGGPRHLSGTGLTLFGVRQVRLVGREVERNHLWAALREARSGHARVVLLRGPSGSGTSHLARWLTHRAHEDAGLRTLWGSHRARPSSSDGVDGMLRNALRCDGLGPSDLQARLGRWLEKHDARPELARPLGVALTGGGTRASRMGAFREVLVRMGRGRPTVVVLDDVQYGAEAVDLALSMAEQPQQAPVLLVLTINDAALRERPSLMAKVRALAQRDAVRDLSLAPLSDAERQQLLRQQLGLDDEVAGRLAEVSEGNPAVALGLLSDWIDDELLEPSEDGGWRLVAGAQIALPDRLLGPWIQRVDRALVGRPDDDGRALELAAMLGMRVSSKLWATACEQGGCVPSDDLVATVQKRGLVSDDPRRGDPGWVFSDGRARAALQKRSETFERADRWHGIVADLLPKQDPRRARHLLAAGRTEEALTPLYVGMLRDLPHAPPAVGAARLRELTSTVEGLSLAADDPRTAWPLHAKGALDLARGDLEAADKAARTLDVLARERGWSKPIARAQVLRSAVARRRLHLTDAAAFASDAIDAATTRADSVRAIRQLAIAERLRGRMRATSSLVREGRTLCVDRGDKDGEGWMWVEVGKLGIAVGRFKDATRALGTARAAFARTGSRAGYCAVAEAFGVLSGAEGDHRGAVQRLSSARLAWQQAGQQRFALRCSLSLGVVALEAGDLELASTTFRDVLAQSAGVGDTRLQLLARLAHGVAEAMSPPTKSDALQGARSALQLIQRAELVDPEVARIAMVGHHALDGLTELAGDQLRRLGRRDEAEAIG